MKPSITTGLITALLLIGCNGSNNFDQADYVSCQINTSQATDPEDEAFDLAQCWDISDGGYESQVYAVEACATQVDSYMSTQYSSQHTVTYVVSQSYCEVDILDF